MHSVIDGYLDKETVAQINREWPTTWESIRPGHKFSTTKLSPTARKVVDSVDLGWLERLTGIEGLLADPSLNGGGFHCIPSGGRLGMHIDFNAHPLGWRRRVNMLIYLNEDWQDEWGGFLQLGIKSPALIKPIGGRAVIFETTEDSYHGHPEPLKCPADRNRRSLALYFYTSDHPKEFHSTIYVS